MQEVHDPCERGDVAVLPDAEIVRGDAAFGKDGGGFREDEANTDYQGTDRQTILWSFSAFQDQTMPAKQN